MLVVNVKFGLWKIIEQVWGRKLWSQEQKKRVWKRNILKSMNSYLWIFTTKNISTLVTWLRKLHACNIEKIYKHKYKSNVVSQYTYIFFVHVDMRNLKVRIWGP